LLSGGFLSQEGVSQSDFQVVYLKLPQVYWEELLSECDKFKVGLNYISDRKSGRNRWSVVATISSRSMKGLRLMEKLGFLLEGINESAIVGDVEFQYRVNADGTLNLRLLTERKR
jgi:hypothetical protein